MNAHIAAMMEAIAENHGMSPEFMREILQLSETVMKINTAECNVTDEEYEFHDRIMKKLGTLERKAKRYDLLIGEEKAAQEDMAGK